MASGAEGEDRGGPLVVDRWPGGFGWIAHPEERMKRASHALMTEAGIWLIDPVDAPGLDDMLAQHGEVRGVVVLLDRHRRDSSRLADRHGVPVTLIGPLGRLADDIEADVERVEGGLPDTGYSSMVLYDNRMWREVVLYNSEDGTMIVPEAVGTAGYYRAPGERLGVHPMLRLMPPRRLVDYEPNRLLVGHGRGIETDASTILSEAVEGARRRLPGAIVRWARHALGRGEPT